MPPQIQVVKKNFRFSMCEQKINNQEVLKSKLIEKKTMNEPVAPQERPSFMTIKTKRFLMPSTLIPNIVDVNENEQQKENKLIQVKLRPKAILQRYEQQNESKRFSMFEKTFNNNNNNNNNSNMDIEKPISVRERIKMFDINKV